jgi:ectoine hydroxylase-related dioxygenase (phytanoyl-CoA dioxygenase family)
VTAATTEIASVAEALAALGVTAETLSQAQRDELDANGFLVLPGLVDADRLAAMRERTTELQRLEGSSAGYEVPSQQGVTLLGDLFNKGEVFEAMFVEPVVLAAAHHVVGNLRVNSLNFRAALPGQGHQGLHPDYHRAVEPGDYHICNSMWMLDDFTEENGATRAVPGSHRWSKLPSDVLDDVTAPHPDEVLLTGTAGTVVIFNSHVWHGGTLNRTDQPRRGMTLSYIRRDEPQQLDQAEYVRKRVYDRLTPAARFLLDV